ncbi:MAG: PAS domain S-box protein [Acidobacteriota bacterium]
MALVLWGKTDYRGLLDSIRTPVVAVNKEWKVTYCNSAYAEMVEKDMEDMEGQSMLELLPDFMGSQSHSAFQEVMESGISMALEHEVGNRRLRERIFTTPNGVMSITFDVTELRMHKELASNADYSTVFNSINDTIFIYDVHTGAILDVNETVADVFGYTREETLRMNVGDLTAGEPPYTKENVLRWVKRTANSGPQCVEWMAQDKVGRLFWIEIKTKRAMIKGNERILAVVRDVTERKQHLRALREGAERYQELFENANDLIYVHDLDGYFITVNKASEKVTGFWREEILRMNMIDLVSESHKELARGYLDYGKALSDKKKATHKAATYELALTTKHGNEIFVEVSTWLVYKMGEPIGMQGIARDITRRKEEEELLRQHAIQMGSIVDSLPDPVLAIDTDGRVIVWNKAIEDMTGVSADDMLGKGDYEYSLPLHGKRRPILVDLVARPEEVEKYYSVSEQDNYTLIGETTAPGLKGPANYLWGKANPLYDENGDLIGAIETIRDLTDHKKTEEAMEGRIRELEAQLQSLQAKLDSKK